MIYKDDFDFGVRDKLGRMIGEKAYIRPDPNLTSRIMKALRPRSKSWPKVFFLKLTTPKTISLSPMASSAAILFLILSGGFLYNGWIHYEARAPVLSESTDRVPVIFRVRAEQAMSVSVIGSFNDWDPKGAEMMPDSRTGYWTIQLDLLPGRYDYVFLIDGENVVPDPYAGINKADGFGHQSSILFVKGQNGRKI